MKLEDLKFGTRVKHVATGKVYTFFAAPVFHSETMEELALYSRVTEEDDLQFWARPLSMFLDGRFEVIK